MTSISVRTPKNLSIKSIIVKNLVVETTNILFLFNKHLAMRTKFYLGTLVIICGFIISPYASPTYSHSGGGQAQSRHRCISSCHPCKEVYTSSYP